MREDFVAYDNLRVYPYDMTYIKDMSIENNINDHASLRLTGIIDDELKDSYVIKTDENSFIEIYYEKEEESYPIFVGLVTKIDINAIEGVYTLSIEAKSLTYMMDLIKTQRDFQDINMTTHQLIKSVMEPYTDSDYSINIPDEPIGKYILQYNETDWEFLKRIASFYNQPLIAAMEYGELHFYVGTPQISIEPKAVITNYKISKCIEEYNDVVNNDNSDVFETDFVNYIIRTQEIYSVGENFKFKDYTFYVKKADYALDEGKLENIYVLSTKGGMRSKRIYNKKLIGISITGSILEVQRDKVRVNLEIGGETEAEGAYWFPYATVAASPTGGGWYCMPEVGERIRLNCPSKDESEAFVVNSIDTYEGKSGAEATEDRMSNPDNKSLQTDAGQEVKFTPNGVNISSSDGQASINLNSDGSIKLSGNTKINISCGNVLTLGAQENIKISAAAGKVDIVGSSGSNILLENNETTFKGQKIRNNSPKE